MSNRHLAASAAAVHEKIMTCSNIYSEARTYTHTDTHTLFRGLLRCVLLRRSVETEMHLAARILLPFGLHHPKKKKKCRTLTHTLTHAHVALRVCVASLSACCGRLQRRLQSVVAAMTRAHTRRHARTSNCRYC